MPNTSCPTCGLPKSRNARQCKQCSNETIRRKLKGVRHSEERRRKNGDAKRRHAAEGRVFDLAAYMRGKPHPFAVPLGTERIEAKGRVVVKCEDGRWRYRARLVWEKANGPIPRGRIIHHANEDPLDDRLENLMMLTRAEHLRIHDELRRTG